MKKLIVILTTFFVCHAMNGQTNTFPASGNVGIGILSPQSLFHLKSNSPTIQLEETDQSNKQWHIQGYNGGLNIAETGIANARIYIKPGGNVGIGLNNPNSKLEIQSSGATYNTSPTISISDLTNRGTMILESITDKPTDFVFKNNGEGRVWLSSRESASGYRFNIYTNPDGIGGPEKLAMSIKQDGSIGFGTSNPTYNSHIKGVTYAGQTLESTLGYDNFILFQESTKQTFKIGIDADKELFKIARTNFNDYSFVMDYNGNIGIGTDLSLNPNNYKLAVNGTIGAKEVKIENTSATWSDFVFSSDYSLRTLPETEKYIKENGHLPDIPSAKEIEEEGISLGEMNAKLLQKIEELILYNIEMNKKLEMLIEKNEKLEKEIEILKTK